MPQCSASAADVVVSYDMNRLQQLPTRTPYVVSLNAGDAIAAGQVVERMVYEHPIYDLTAVAAQRRLPELADGRTAYAGSYHGWGFHEDGCRSGVEAALSLGVAW
jgi:predicted NAD/FAD-binding protein